MFLRKQRMWPRLLLLLVGVFALGGCGSGIVFPPIPGPGAIVQVGSVNLLPGGVGDVSIIVLGVPQGLLGMEVSVRAGNLLRFDPTQIHVTDVVAQFPLERDAANINNTDGSVSFIVRRRPSTSFPASIQMDVIVHILVQAVGSSGSSSTMTLTVTNLIDTDGQKVPIALIIPGNIVIH